MGKVNTMSVVKVLQKQTLLSFSLLLFTLSIGILIGTLLTHGVSAQKGTAAPDATPLTIPDPVQLSTAFSQLAKKLEPSVVNITATSLPKQAPAAGSRRRQQQQVVPQDPGDNQGFDLFRFFQSPFGDSPQSQQPRQGTGSGVVVDPNGYILTNNHVVDGADRLQVHLTGDPVGTDYEAKLIGVDLETDLAVIKIDTPQKLPAAKIGNSDAVQVGDWAVAIGSPFGLEATVTAGIISAKERTIEGSRQFQHFLQTDAAINPGNSGGPLLNIKGEVIGINTAIATSTNGYQGVGFALPINTAVSTYNQLIKSGKVVRGSIGVSLEPAPKPELLQVYGASQGAFVSAVRPGSPAADAGVKEGDVIVSLNGKPITKSDDLVNAVAETQVGTKATLGVIRDSKRTDVPVTIGDRAQIYADDDRVAGPRPSGSSRGESSESMFGIYVRNLEPADIEDSGFPEKSGVLVTKVDPTSFADDIGLAPNDVVTEINRQPVKTVADLQRIQATLKPGVGVAFRALRPAGSLGGRGRTLTWQPIFRSGTLPRK
jgi:serine protease Do